MAKFGQGVSDAQIALARKFSNAGLTSFSQAVKAFQKRNDVQIEEWKRHLTQLTEEKKKNTTTPLAVPSHEHTVKIEVEDYRDLAELDAYERHAYERRYQD